MTGMGSARVKVGSSYLTVEIKSVNHKYCEVNARFPGRYQIFELAVIQQVKKKISRGKIDVFLFEEKVESAPTYSPAQLKKYHAFLKKIAKDLKVKDDVTLSHLLSGSSFWMVRDQDQKKFEKVIHDLVDKAIDSLKKMRQSEGSRLKEIVASRLSALKKLRGQIMTRKDAVLAEYHDKLQRRVQTLLQGVELDPSKLANEVAHLADRSDISEELDRLSSHFLEMDKKIKSSEPVGRALDFLIQEINREWNTIASKSGDAGLAHIVVEAKSELEKIREQIQNVE